MTSEISTLVSIIFSAILTGGILAWSIHARTKSFEEEYKDKVNEIGNFYNVKLAESIKKLCERSDSGGGSNLEFSQARADTYYYEIQDVSECAGKYERWVTKIEEGKMLLRKSSGNVFLTIFFAGIAIASYLYPQLFIFSISLALFFKFMIGFTESYGEYSKMMGNIDRKFIELKLKKTRDW